MKKRTRKLINTYLDLLEHNLLIQDNLMCYALVQDIVDLLKNRDTTTTKDYSFEDVMKGKITL